MAWKFSISCSTIVLAFFVRESSTWTLPVTYTKRSTTRKQGHVNCRATDVRMTATKIRREENAQGNLFVDESCIDCDTCRWMEGGVFTRVGGMSAVTKQPQSEEERRSALRAMVSCPTGSIRTEESDPLVKEVLRDFPFAVDSERLPAVFHLGFHDKDSFAASPWLVVRDEGNVMVDCPRWNRHLADQIQAAGGLDVMFLTHIDDVGAHETWKKHFPEMRRVMHRSDTARAWGDTGKVEVKLDASSATGHLEGLDMWDLGSDLKILHTPGHTDGSLTLIYEPLPASEGGPGGEGVAFTGDHLAYSAQLGGLTTFARYRKGSAEAQAHSVEVLAHPSLSFRWLMPGHGRKIRFATDQERIDVISRCAKEVAGGKA